MRKCALQLVRSDLYPGVAVRLHCLRDARMDLARFQWIPFRGVGRDQKVVHPDLRNARQVLCGKRTGVQLGKRDYMS